jgi:peptidyl-prolyl cis-trans isomerase SurA|tara:strand:- start:24 stop:1277 length:1254 start_codon:yes stop_codon:yes gene_type:complete
MKFNFFVFFVLSNLIFSEVEFLDRIAVIVDEGIIMESEVNDALAQTINNFKENGERLPPNEILFQRVLERLIIDEILLQKAKKFGVRISDQELNEALANFADQDGLSLKEFKEKIERESKSFVLFREEMKAEMIKRRVQSGLVGPKVVISEEEVMNYINSAEGENLFSIEYKINQILLKNDDEEDLKKAKAIINEIENGLSFEEAQKNYSSLFDNDQNGSLGWRTRSQIPTLFSKKIIEMEKNEIFGPIKSGAGVHIIKLEDIRGETIQTESQTLVQHILIKESEIRSEKQAKDLIDSLHTRLRNGEEMSILARVYSDDPGSKLDGGKLDWAPLGIYDKKFEEIMLKTDTDSFSKPFKSSFGWHVLKVLDRREKNISDDLLKDKAYGILFQRKYREQLQNTLEEIRAEAFVDIKISS